MKIALAQINPTVGDWSHNCHKILSFAGKASVLSVDLMVTPELSLVGYPAKDLLLRRDFLAAQQSHLDNIAKKTPIPVLVGGLEARENHLPYNAAWLCDKNGPRVVARKLLLPNYNVFDEKRYFSTPSGDACTVLTFNHKKILLSICEDAWSNLDFEDQHIYDFDPVQNAIIKHGPIDFIINMSASPYTKSKPSLRERMFTHVAKNHGVPFIMVNQVGALDQWLFDGHSLIINGDGTIIDRTETCVPDLIVFDSDNPHKMVAKTAKRGMALLHDVLVMGIRDYVEKCQLPGVIIGLSGGIDSAVVATLAVRALSARRVKAVYLPSRFSSPQSYEDAYALATNLGIKMDYLLIEDSVQSLRDLLANFVTHTKNASIVDQNLQARIRGLIIMALTNVDDHIMVATSNKSELAVGFATIYGDMCGAFSPIGDLYKTEVYELAEEINRMHPVIPNSILNRAPTAELTAHQLDTDSLPRYEELDQILKHFIDYESSAAEIHASTKLDYALIDRVISMVDRSEYKRRQGPFPFMVSDKVFGDARRLPIAKKLF